MASALVQRLDRYSRLSQSDREALEQLNRLPVQRVSARTDLIREGENPRHVRLIVEGWACRYKSTLEGSRQIVGFFIPGDFCDFNVYILRQMDHSIGTLTRARVAQITPDQVEALTAEHPRIAQAFWWHELVNASIQREWLLSLGQRPAFQRIGHLLVELFYRLRIAGLVDGDSCDFPLTQSDLAEATGLTAVHVNRTIQELRREGLVELDRKRLRIPDLSALCTASEFNSSYLHLDREGRHLDAND